MVATDAKLARAVTRFAFAIAIAVATAFPLGYWSLGYSDLADRLTVTARVRAYAIGGQVADNPDLWKYMNHKLQDVLQGGPVPLGSDFVEVYDSDGEFVTSAGSPPSPPSLRRSFTLFDAGRVAGRVDASASLQSLIWDTAWAVLVGLVLGSSVFIALRVLPLRALRRLTQALFDQKERVEVTLHSIGDAVITTDGGESVEYMNPVAERLTGWTLAEAKGRSLENVLHLIDGATGNAVSNPLRRAIAEKKIVSLDCSTELVRRDDSRIAIEDSAAPIRDPQGGIAGGVLIFRDVSVARSFAKQRSWEATHDVLTGLVNRRAFEVAVDDSLAVAKSSGTHHVVCYMDLDQFKLVNDTCGHAAGDELLKSVAALFRSRTRQADTLARLGGDEFGLLLYGCSVERAQRIAGDLLGAVRAFRFAWEGKTFTIGVSIGLTSITGETTSAADVLSTADTACYWAKENGRNRVGVYRVGDADMAARRREKGWIARINAALEADRFVLYYQDYLALSASAGTRKHLEVLVRMIDEEGHLVQPGSFLPAAERYNLMSSIDQWVIRKTFANYDTLVGERGTEPITCAINLSAGSINSETFLDFLREQAREHPLPPDAICFEVTEAVALGNLGPVAQFIGECKDMGFLFALDDFGSGTSTFAYLKDLDIDYLKIDGGLVKNLQHDAIDKAMADTINRVGHIMGVKTVAEFAENAAILDLLKSMGVDYAQGYAVSTPSPLFAAAVEVPATA